MTSSSGVSVVEEALRIVRANPDQLIAVVGPTASGKTELAIALAEHLNGEIVSADSVQVYREFDLGSGKPTADELARAPHHLVSFLGPRDPIDAAAWAERASHAIEDVRARGRVAIVCGGTYLWVKALLCGLAEAPSANAEIRARLLALAEAEGLPALHAQLREVDPVIAERVHPNDLVRVTRALEVWEITGKPLSLWQSEHGFGRIRYPACLLGIATDTVTLTERIRTRAHAWLGSGWIEEVAGLLERGYGDARAMGSVGYAQVRAMLDGELPRTELEASVVRATRVFARRQRTWLNHVDVTWLGPQAESRT